MTFRLKSPPSKFIFIKEKMDLDGKLFDMTISGCA
jgi:hypothetical protein